MNGSAICRISIADRTRVGTCTASSASCIASELITVASIPMWSPVTRSSPSVAAADDHGDLDPLAAHVRNLGGDAPDHDRIEPVGAGPHQGLARELQEDASIAGRRGQGPSPVQLLGLG